MTGRPVGRGKAALLVLAAVSVVAMVVVMVVVGREDGTSAPPTTTIPVGGTLRLGVVGPAVVTDPALLVATDAGSAMVDDLLWLRLTATDPTTAAAVPSLAESWEASADLTRFRFRLRPDAVFSDGSPLTSTDVAASLTRIAAQGVASLASGPLSVVQGYAEAPSGGLAGITTPDATTLDIQLTEPVADLPALLAAPAYGVVPAAVVRGERPALPGPTSGPYAVETQDTSGMRLRRAPATPVDRARPDVVEISRYDSEDAAAAAYGSGALDLVPLGADRIGDLVAPGVGVVRLSPAAAVWWIAADTTDPTMSSVEVRRGIAHAADRPAIVGSALPGRRPLDGVVPPQVPGGTEGACGPACALDPAATTAAVAATFPSGAPAVLVDGPETAGPSTAVSAFASALTTAGLPASTRTRAVADYRAQVLSPDKQLFWFGWVGLAPTPEAYLPALFLSGSPENVTGLSDPAVDAAIRAARATADADARAARWADAERLVLERMPVVPLAQAQHAVALSAHVQGFVQRLDGTFAVDRLWIAAP